MRSGIMFAAAVFLIFWGVAAAEDDADSDPEHYYYQAGIEFSAGRMASGGSEVADIASLISLGDENFVSEEMEADFTTSAFNGWCDAYLSLEDIYFEDPEVEEGCTNCVSSSRTTDYLCEVIGDGSEIASFGFSLEIKRICCDCPSEYDEGKTVKRCYENDRLLMIIEFLCPKEEFRENISLKVYKVDAKGKKNGGSVLTINLSGLEVPEENGGYDDWE